MKRRKPSGSALQRLNVAPAAPAAKRARLPRLASSRVIKRHFFLIAAAVLLGLMVLAAILRIALASDGPAAGPGGPGRAQQVSEAVVTSHPFSDQLRVLGVARGARSVNITSSTTELITRVLFTDGQRVAAGAPLVELQAREEDAAIIEAVSYTHLTLPTKA
mgnify:CR=1 FL=1